MNAALRHDQTPKADYAGKTPIFKSAIFHIVIFTIAAVGMPFVAKDKLTVTPPINVEIVDIDEISQTNRVAPPKKKEPEEKPPAPEQAEDKPKQMTAELPPDLLSPAPPEIEDAVPPPPKPEPEKKVEEKPKPKPKKPKAKPKPPAKKKEKQEDQFASLLKNLTPDTDTAEKTEEPLDPTQDSSSPISQIATLSDKMTISELDALRQQIAPCWNVPAGAKYAEDLVVEARVTMNRDGTVQNASILNRSRYNQDSHFRAAADAAMRALRNPRCQPLKLPADKYNQWKTIVINFDPREML